VHIHTERPDEVLRLGLALGALSSISVENLDRQAHEARQKQARGLGMEHAYVGIHSHAGAEAVTLAEPAEGSGDGFGPSHGGPAIVAVTTGDGLEAVFRSFGVSDVVGGGQSANPSTGEILRAADRFDGREVLVLPNNPNVKLAAEQAAALRPTACLIVVPTRNAAEGFAALLAFEPSHDAQTNAAAMLTAARSIQTLQVTEAVRDAKVGGRKVRKGQTMVLDPDDGLVGAGSDRTAAILAAVGTLTPGFELLTVYYGDGADLAEAEALSTSLRAAVRGVDVELVRGGQPYYRYLISAE
jgi:dihydroxyacetone kinase-like predicted kinase